MLKAMRDATGELYNIRDAAHDRGRGNIALPFATFEELDAHGRGPYRLMADTTTPRPDQIATGKPTKEERRQLSRRRALEELTEARARQLDPDAFA